MEKIAHRMGNAVLVGALFVSVSAFLFSMSASLTLAQEEIDTFKEDMPAPSQPQMGQQEIRDFLNQFKDLQRDTKKVANDLKGATSAEADAWKQRLQTVQTQAADCVKRMNAATNETRLEVRDECHSLGLWDEVNEIREQFVPAQEIKNTTNDIKRQMNELKRMEKKLKKLKLDTMQASITELLNKLNEYHANITKATGAEQREALQSYQDAQLWEEINAFNARINIPDELSQSKKDLSRVEKQLGQSAHKKALAYFDIAVNDIAQLVSSKKSAITEIESLLADNDAQGAQELMQENFHDYSGWNPGELQHLLDMFRDTQQRLKRIKDKKMTTAIREVIDPIIAAMLDGDVRGARETMEAFMRELQKYEEYFYKLQPKGLGKKTRAGLENLESLIEKKFSQIKEQAEKQENKEETKATEQQQKPSETPSLQPLMEEEESLEKQSE